MSHNCNRINNKEPSASGLVNINELLTARLSLTRIAFTSGPYTYSNGQRYPFAYAGTRALAYASGVTYENAVSPVCVYDSSVHAMSFVISGAGTYLLVATLAFVENGAATTVRWKDTTGATLGPKTRQQTTSQVFANKVWGVVSFTGATRTVYVEVNEITGTLQTVGMSQASTINYVQILQIN